MSFTDSAKICLNKYLDFNGRASRSEYWWFVLLTFALGFIPIIGWLIRLVLILPSLAVQVRRLHDMGRSAWWLLLLVPPITIIGGPVLLIMSIFPGTPGHNRYGPDPLASQPGTGGYGFTEPGGTYGSRDPYSPEPDDVSHYAAIPAPPAGTEEQSETRRFCTQCGMQLQPEARFCNICGASV